MSKFVAESAYQMVNEDGDIVVSFVVHGMDKQAAIMMLQEARACGKRLDIEVKPYRSRRSIEQNRLLWALLGKMAEATSGYKRTSDVEELYCNLLLEANIKCSYFLGTEEGAQTLKSNFRVVRRIGEREVNGKVLPMYQCFSGSSKFDTKEMTELIELALDKLADLGIYDSEIEVARREYL